MAGTSCSAQALIRLAHSGSIPQNPEQVTVRIQSVFFRRFNQAADHTAGLCAARRIREQPILAAHGKRLYTAFRTVVAQLQLHILQIADQVRPLLQQIVQGPKVDNDSQKIYVSLPEAKINSNQLMWDSSMECNEKNNILNPIDFEQYQTLISDIKAEGLREAEKNGLYDTVEQNAKNLITNFLGCFVGYEVVFM